MIKKVLINLFLLCVVYILFSGNLFANYIHPMFPFGDTNSSISCHLQFISVYPSGDLPVGMRSSPVAYNDSGYHVVPYFYVVPTEYLSLALSDYYAMKLYSVSCLLFFDDVTNWIIIAPTEPFSYNTSYSVVFDNFPLWEPNTSVDSGYTAIAESAVFVDYIKTMNYPLSIKDVSFQKTGNVIWNANDDIVVYFSDSIAPNLSILDSMFSVIKVGESVVDSAGALSYDLITIPTSAVLSSDGRSVVLEHTDPFSPGSYFLRVDLEHYLGDDFFNTSYNFDVYGKTDESDASILIVDIRVHFPDSFPVGEFRYKGYDGQKIYYYGDTVRVGFPATYKDYYLSEWKLPETTDGILYQYGEILEIILDTANYFSNSFENPVFNQIKRTGITIDVYYDFNPLDTLRVDLELDSGLVSQFLNYKDYLVVTGVENKIDDLTYTFRRYSGDSIFISYDFEGVLQLDTSIIGGGNKKSIPVLTNVIAVAYVVSLGINLIFPQNGVSVLAIPAPPIGTTNPRDTVVIIIPDVRYEQEIFCNEMGKITVELFFEGYNGGRAFQDNLANIRDMISSIMITDMCGSVKYPQFSGNGYVNDSTTQYWQKISDEVIICNQNSNTTIPIGASYSVVLNNPDYEIFLVTTSNGPNRCSVNGDIVRRGNKGNNYNFGNYNYNYISGKYVYDDYKLPGASMVMGNIQTYRCENTLRIYIRRKIVEFAFDIDHPKFYNGMLTTPGRVPNIAYFNFNFEGENPIYNLKKDYLPKSNYTRINFTNNYGYYECWTEFLGIDIPVANSLNHSYHRRDANSSGSVSGLNSREEVWEERVSVFYYSGENFTYQPWLKESCGYKVQSVSVPNANYLPNPILDPKKKVTITDFKNSDKILCEATDGFILEYIRVPQLKKGGDDPAWEYIKYAVDDRGNTDEHGPIWKDGMLDGYDNGLYLNEQVGGTTLHMNTVRIHFKFNKDIYQPSIPNNIKIEDFKDKYPPYNVLRPDGNGCSDYPIIFSTFGNNDGNADQGGQIGDLYVTLVNEHQAVNKGVGFKMCNLQRFGINIINTENNPILGGIDVYDINDLESLENLKSSLTRSDGFTFRASTIPPSISTSLLEFGTLGLLDSWMGNTEAYIHLATEVNVTAAKNPLDAIIPVKDDKGRITFDVETRRFPAADYYELGYWDATPPGGTGFLKRVDFLKERQCVLHTFHWADDNQWWFGLNCKKIMDEIAAAKSISKKVEDKDWNSIIISAAKDEFVKYLCDYWHSPADKYLGRNDFWLVRSAAYTTENNQYICLAPLFTTIPGNINFITDPDALIQDWNLWGAGVYGMYEEVDRYAYNKQFVYKEVKIDNKKCYIPENQPTFYTKIRIKLGDR